VNQVTSLKGDAPNAREVPFGWSDIAPGNFTYLKRYDAKGHVVGYMLVGYAATPESADRIDMDQNGETDGAIIVLVSGIRDATGAVGLQDSPQELYEHGLKHKLWFVN